ncbi:MAG: hypothetical protein M1374_05405 [Firmicutes bacterium]|jgi:heme-degrading monooxygenase HmoA|nr:hypothetical protein [Bacillota bacterium]
MITEIAILELHEGTVEQFIAKLQVAITFLEQTAGYRSIEVKREIENK